MFTAQIEIKYLTTKELLSLLNKANTAPRIISKPSVVCGPLDESYFVQMSSQD